MKPHTLVIWQIVNHSIGTRTPPIKSSMAELVDFFKEKLETLPEESQKDGHNYLEDLVLIVSDDTHEETILTVSDWPLMKIKTFVKVVPQTLKATKEQVA